tara:strand:+ start:1416 stop:2009 length:594 start_codon:yes stop_codon:yes gene_type:complete
MELPIFPLNGAVLFPDTSLPLNIFEKRYLEMVDHALSKNRFIGMIQTKDNGQLFNVGCMGKIHSFNETSDGRYLISLQGISCFKVMEELKTSYSFRSVKANKLDNKIDNYIFSDDQKNLLLKLYADYISIKNINLNLKDIENIEMDQIIKFIAMVSPFNNIDKQALLEADSLLEFFNKLLSIFELELAGDISSKSIN